LKAGPGTTGTVSRSPSKEKAERERTDATAVARKPKLLKHHLVAIRLQCGEGVRLLGEDQSGFGRVASLGRFVVEELAVPYLPLRFPAHDEPLFYRSTKCHLAKIPAFLQF